MSKLHQLSPRAAVAAGAALIAGASALPAYAQVNGALDAGEYGPAIATQNVGTGFGNNFSELNAAYGKFSPGTGIVNLLITGNLEGNGNGIVLFLDSRPGGAIASTLGSGHGVMGSMGGARIDDWGTDTDGGAGVSATPGGGSILSPGFNPDVALEINSGGGGANYFINVIDLTIPNEPNPDKDIFLGSNATNGPAVTQTYTRSTGPAGDITHAFNNTNTAGVNATGDPAGDPLSATTGLELGLSTPFLNPGVGVTELKVFAVLTNGGGDFLSNQFLPGIGATDNLGGPGGLGGAPLFDIREFSGATSYFSIVVPEPATAGLMLMLTATMSRRARRA
jgi:hypothetical protein